VLKKSTFYGVRSLLLRLGQNHASIFEGNSIQRYFQDVHVISQHAQSSLANYELIGKHVLGLKVDPGRF